MDYRPNRVERICDLLQELSFSELSVIRSEAVQLLSEMDDTDRNDRNQDDTDDRPTDDDDDDDGGLDAFDQSRFDSMEFYPDLDD